MLVHMSEPFKKTYL